jgi:hypothetical protein
MTKRVKNILLLALPTKLLLAMLMNLFPPRRYSGKQFSNYQTNCFDIVSASNRRIGVDDLIAFCDFLLR